MTLEGKPTHFGIQDEASGVQIAKAILREWEAQPQHHFWPDDVPYRSRASRISSGNGRLSGDTGEGTSGVVAGCLCVGGVSFVFPEISCR